MRTPGSGGYGVIDGAGKGTRAPVKQQSGHHEQEVIAVEVQGRERASRDNELHQVGDPNRAHDKREHRPIFGGI